MREIGFVQMVSVSCGIDVHQDLIVASIRKSADEVDTREFEAYTSSLTSLREWCKSEGVTHVAMESTGVYWKPVFNVLEEDFEVILVNARHVKNIPGHKTDKKDSRIPPCDIRELRDLVRYRKKVVGQIASEKNRIIKILEDANIKLSSVLSNVDGAVGTKTVNDLIKGETSVDKLMCHYHGKQKVSRIEFRKALEGRVTPHHRLMLGFHRDSISGKESQLKQLDEAIDRATAICRVRL